MFGWSHVYESTVLQWERLLLVRGKTIPVAVLLLPPHSGASFIKLDTSGFLRKSSVHKMFGSHGSSEVFKWYSDVHFFCSAFVCVCVLFCVCLWLIYVCVCGCSVSVCVCFVCVRVRFVILWVSVCCQFGHSLSLRLRPSLKAQRSSNKSSHVLPVQPAPSHPHPQLTLDHAPSATRINCLFLLRSQHTADALIQEVL